MMDLPGQSLSPTSRPALIIAMLLVSCGSFAIVGDAKAQSPASQLALPPSARVNAAPATNLNAPAIERGNFSRPGESLPANWFLDSIAIIRENIQRLLPELQRYAASQPVAREVINDVYRLDAEADALYRRTRVGEPIESIFATYQQLDLRWQDVSYRLRASGAVDARMAPLVDSIDDTFRVIDRRLGVTPPIDRVRLRDLMIVTLTYMDAMFDDIRLSPTAFGRSETLIRDGRLLRERLRQESYKMDRASHDEVVASYTEFVRQWRAYAAGLYQLNDPHINQRLESIRRQGDEVYTSLRIPAATDRGQLQYAGQRLTASLVAVQNELLRWGANRLPADQLRFVETLKSLIDRSRRLETELSRGSVTANARNLFAEMDRSWTDGLRSMRAVDPRSGLQASLAQADAIFGELRSLLQSGPSQGQNDLLRIAASLEAAADSFNDDAQVYKKYLTPVTFRDQFSRTSIAVYESSRDLHRALDERRDSREITRLAQQLAANWQQLTPLFSELTLRGLSDHRAQRLFEGAQAMQPLVAQTSTMLLN
jgi:hypothetical protein